MVRRVPSTAPSLDVTVSDPEGGNLTVTYYGRPTGSVPGPDFTLIGLPDTQYYTGQLNGGSPAIFDSQTNWMVANRAARNIVYVGELGDCVEHGDNGGNDIEWQRANTSLGFLENAITTGLPEGIPYGVSVGNHDQSPIGDASGTTTFYNQYFGAARFTGRTYYGGHYGANNDNWYELFSASGMDFIVISFEYDTSPDAAVLAWADNLLTTYGNRRAIVLSHFICNTGNPAGFGPQGQAIYDALKGHANLDLMLCGHVPGEGRRQDTFNGNTVYTMLSDYQSRTAGGNGWLRILEFSPANNEIRVKTYSPWLNQFETDGDSQFSVPYEMNSTPEFALIGTVSGVPSGSTASLAWPGRAVGTTYEWYATVSDGSAATPGPVWNFTAGSGTNYTLTYTAGPNGSITGVVSQSVSPGGSGSQVTAVANPGYHFVDWSDGVTTTSRTDTNVQANLAVTANFAANPPVPAIAGLTATQNWTGNPDGGTTGTTLNWNATANTVEVWRAGYGHYPEYSDAAGAAPAASPTYPPGAGWVKTTVTTPGGVDYVTLRDYNYYVAYQQDVYGTWSAASTMTSGILNYHLGDVSDGFTPGAGNNLVDTPDVSLLGSAYGFTGGAVVPVAYLDVGPTETMLVDGVPTTDNRIDFEDLVMFAINYGRTSPPNLGPVALDAQRGANELVLEAPDAGVPGTTATARLLIKGAGDLVALSTTLSWDPAVVAPTGQAAGEWLAGQNGVVFSAAPGRIDAAVLQAGGMTGSGALATVTFRVLSAGAPGIRIASTDGRDARNQKVTVATAQRPLAAVAPTVTRLAPSKPNPFNATATISYSLAKGGPVELLLYSVDGRRVRTLGNGVQGPGEYTLTWDGRDDHGGQVAAGIYYLHMLTEQGRFRRTMTYLK